MLIQMIEGEDLTSLLNIGIDQVIGHQQLKNIFLDLQVGNKNHCVALYVSFCSKRKPSKVNNSTTVIPKPDVFISSLKDTGGIKTLETPSIRGSHNLTVLYENCLHLRRNPVRSLDINLDK